jgi:hypothetical protein
MKRRDEIITGVLVAFLFGPPIMATFMVASNYSWHEFIYGLGLTTFSVAIITVICLGAKWLGE